MNLEDNMLKNPFSLNGRIRRTKYALSIIIALALVFITIFIDNSILENDLLDTYSQREALLISIIFIFNFILGFLFAQGAKRCHDRGRSGWFQFIPFYILWMIFADSEYGNNEYGPNPKGIGNEYNEKTQKIKFKNTGLVIASIFIISSILSITLIIILNNSPPPHGKRNIPYLKLSKDANEIMMHIESYAFWYGEYPTEEQGIMALVEKPTVGNIPKNYKPIINKKAAILDPWGTPYILKKDPKGELQIITLGKDKKKGGEGKNADFNILKEDEYPDEFRGK